MFSIQRSRSRRAAAGLAVMLAFASGGWLDSPVALADPGSRFLVITGAGSSNIGVLGLDRAGKLSKVAGSPFASGTGALSVTITPDGRKVYSANVVSGTVDGFELGADGTLTPIADAHLDLGGPGVGILAAPDGRTVFVSTGSVTNELRSYRITDTGGLAPTGAAPVRIPGISGLSMPAISPDGKYLFLVGWLDATVISYAVGPNGALTQVDSVPAGLMSTIPGVTPDGRFLYTSNEAEGNISGYSIGGDGSLTPIPGSPFRTGVMPLPHGAMFTSDSKRLYMAEAMAGGIAGFAIAENGALSPLPGSPYKAPAGTLPGRVLVDSVSQHVFLIDTLTVQGTSRVHTYAMAADGRLTSTDAPAVDTGLIFADGPNAWVATQ
ncbi:beta-propeller fold lactonase family protein [Nocardia neocaledoniensis]|uniref:lactonase family protein n=1 Tax=Nocardia neocaledoniensis TaxID=236511 RepID=UPI00340A63FF